MSNLFENPAKQVYKSDYLLENILKYLDLYEQLRLPKISKRFECVLKKKLWRKTYTDINLYRIRYAIVIIQNESVIIRNSSVVKEEVLQTKIDLTHKQAEEFLNLNAKNIKSLKVSAEYYMIMRDIKSVLKNIKNFKNLRELYVKRLSIDNQFMLHMARNCKKLQKLYLQKCCSESSEALKPGDNLSLEILYEMKQLRELVIENDINKEVKLEFSLLQEILINLKLKTLIFKNFIIENNVNTIKDLNNNNLKVLNMGCINKCVWSYFICDLEEFENLKELYINSHNSLNILNEDINMLSIKCLQLEKLSLDNCQLYIKDFRPLKQLKYLSLKNCKTLTFHNLQQILEELNLKSFSLLNTEVCGTVTLIYISSTLEEITLDCSQFSLQEQVFQMSLKTFKNVHTLKWLNGEIIDTWLLDECPNLKKLQIPSPGSLQKLILTMAYLKELTLTSFRGVTWCFILNLICNLKLERLNLETQESIENCEIPDNACGIKTTLDSILMPIHIFMSAESFWLELLELNETLHYVIYGKFEEMDFNWLEELIGNELFGWRVKLLKICGFDFGKLL